MPGQRSRDVLLDQSNGSAYTTNFISRSGGNSNFDKFENQDVAIEAFRKFATRKNVNIILVIHPRKEDDKFALGISSIFGTAKATQEADMVLILQRVPIDPVEMTSSNNNSYSSYKVAAAPSHKFVVSSGAAPSAANQPAKNLTGTNYYLEVKKNRYDGTVGKVNLDYKKESMTYSEV